LFELKLDGFRSLAYVEDGECRLMSRNRNAFKSWPEFCARVAKELKADSAILDGEIVALDDHGRPQFYDLLFRRPEPRFFVFDLLWLDGEDLRNVPLMERKKRLRKIIRRSNSSLLYVDFLETHGRSLFEKVCAMDLEGIVAKRKDSTYRA